MGGNLLPIFFFNFFQTQDIPRLFFFESERYHQQKCISNLPQFGLDGGNNFAKGCLQFLPFIFKNQSSNLQLFAFLYLILIVSSQYRPRFMYLLKRFYVKPNFTRGGTDLGRLICNFHTVDHKGCRNFRIFLSLRFKIFFGKSRSSKIAVLANFWGSEFPHLVHFSIHKVQKFIKMKTHSL